MNYQIIAGLYKDYTDKKYINNPKLAEEINDAISKVRSLGSTKNGIDNWVEEICNAVGAKTSVEKYIIISFITIKTNSLRLVYDEEYAEMQFCL